VFTATCRSVRYYYHASLQYVLYLSRVEQRLARLPTFVPSHTGTAQALERAVPFPPTTNYHPLRSNIQESVWPGPTVLYPALFARCRHERETISAHQHS